ncbi:hypothetical protein [Cyclobacterium plantarum]|uniref:hypothetical protein n=1 Tax=Cyclobacterium plantarum TaxID=2716263 RepID=UPI003F6E90F2
MSIMGIRKVINEMIVKVLNEIRVLKGEERNDIIYFSKSEYKTLRKAKEAFDRSRTKLFDVNQWSKMPGLSSTFALFCPDGSKKLANMTEIGDYILIHLPGPMPENWVKITSLISQEDFAEFVVSPSEKPVAKEGNEAKIAHFFSEEASSTFRIRRTGTTLFAYEIGREESINNAGEQAADREWINTLIAEGAWLGFQKIQWKNLTDYLVHVTEIEKHQK